MLIKKKESLLIQAVYSTQVQYLALWISLPRIFYKSASRALQQNRDMVSKMSEMNVNLENLYSVILSLMF